MILPRITLLILSFLLLGAVQVKDVTVSLINADLLDKIIKERGNRILVVNVWATWCIPCREEFPDLIKLADEFKGMIDLVAISVDYNDEIESKVKPFLKQHDINFDVFISDFEKDSDLIEYFDDNWNGALPATFIYTKTGEKYKFMEGKQSYESLSSAIKNFR